MNKQHTILVVDDELIGRQLLQAILISEGYNVLLAENGLEAIEKVEQFTPDLVLMDVMMPDMDGFSAIQKIKENSSLSHIPIILVTALDDRDNRIKGLESGATDYISKPFDRIEVLAKIKNIAGKKVKSDSGTSQEEQKEVQEEKLNFIINEIAGLKSENSSFQIQDFSPEDSINKLGIIGINTTTGFYQFIFGSESPTEEDNYQLSLITIWLNQILMNSGDPSNICSKIEARIGNNPYFNQKQWWLAAIFIDLDKKIFISGLNQKIHYFLHSVNSGRYSKTLSLTTNKLVEIETLELIMIVSGQLSDKLYDSSFFSSLAPWIENKQWDKIKSDLEKLEINSKNGKVFAVGIQRTP
jgi:CheY-like chemotaxis protein